MNTPPKTILLWFRQDLRLEDNAALHYALGLNATIIPVYLFLETDKTAWPMGSASQWWLHHSLLRLQDDLRSLGSTLIIRKGELETILPSLLSETQADGIVFHRRYEPIAQLQEAVVSKIANATGCHCRGFSGSTLFEPACVRNKSDLPFQVFSAFWRHCLTLGIDNTALLKRPTTLSSPSAWPKSCTIEDLNLLPTIPWDAEIAKNWSPGEKGAQIMLTRFVKEAVTSYDPHRDHPYREGTSKLSPYLHFGEISPRQILAALAPLQTDPSLPISARKSIDTYIKELGWREFANHLLYYFPETPLQPLKEKFKAFPWDINPEWLKCWQMGQTGYPIVDAGMRQLWRTGWMHNRVRMIVASFLVKDLLIPWQDGAKWFWDTLVDADLASNTMGWQWTAGCGADAAPYFRVFNPILQGEKFDPQGQYVRQWVPELSRLDNKWIHQPWQAPPLSLFEAGIQLGNTYPHPIVDHATARDKALKAFSQLKQA